MNEPVKSLADALASKGLNERSREVLKHIVDAYVETGKGFGNYLIVMGIIETVALFVMVFVNLQTTQLIS